MKPSKKSPFTGPIFHTLAVVPLVVMMFAACRDDCWIDWWSTVFGDFWRFGRYFDLRRTALRAALYLVWLALYANKLA